MKEKRNLCLDLRLGSPTEGWELPIALAAGLGEEIWSMTSDSAGREALLLCTCASDGSVAPL